ncbi:hypothetical protein [uncultured Friedmanniella sp.]|uniref:hypothetical protein n=1 Tax=uncultured Friedmanniella sp. TaxID=335381 RepID=UPI0035CA86C8
MAAARRVRPSTLLAATVGAALLVASWSAPDPALATLSPAGFAVRPMTSTYDDVFTPSTTGNPVTDSGLVAGSTLVGRNDRAAVYNLHSHTLTTLGTLGGRNSWGTDVNAAGDVVGYSELTFRGYTHAFLWTARTGVMHDLGSFDGRGDYSQANAISDAGVVVGWGTPTRPDQTPHAFVWDPTASPVRMRELALPPGTRTATATAVNARGQVVGRATGDDDEGVLWDPGTTQPTVLSSPPGARIVGAVDINDAGFVVGPAAVDRTGPSGAYPASRSYRWSPTTRSSALLVTAPVDSDYYDEVTAINRYGIIVGVSRQFRLNRLAVWNACGTPVYVLPAPDGQGSTGTGVNRYGEIVGTSSTSPTWGAEFVRADPCTAGP